MKHSIDIARKEMANQSEYPLISSARLPIQAGVATGFSRVARSRGFRNPARTGGAR